MSAVTLIVRPGMQRWLCPDVVIFTIFLYMIAAYSLFPRDFDEGTIDFLRSLPVSRGQIFFAKVLAAWLLICLLSAAEFTLGAIALSLNTQTITGQYYWYNELVFLLRYVLFAFVIVAHGVFISWFRTLGLILYLVYLIGLMTLEQAYVFLAPYSIFRFFNNEYSGQQIMMDWPVVTTHVLAAVVLLALSYLLWTGTDSKPKAPRQWQARTLPASDRIADGIRSGCPDDDRLVNAGGQQRQQRQHTTTCLSALPLRVPQSMKRSN